MKRFELTLWILLILSVSYAFDIPYRFTKLKDPSDISALNQNFNTIAVNSQDKIFTIVSSTPSITDGNNGNIVILHTNTLDKLMIKVNGVWKSTQIQ